MARRVALRMRRQTLVSHPQAPRLWAVVGEAVLHHEVGGPAVLREQLAHLVELTGRPSVTLQVVPLRIGGATAEGAFTMLRFAEPELPDVVYLEHLCGALYVDKRDEVEQYSKVVQRLAYEAATPEQTHSLLTGMIASLPAD